MLEQQKCAEVQRKFTVSVSEKNRKKMVQRSETKSVRAELLKEIHQVILKYITKKTVKNLYQQKHKQVKNKGLNHKRYLKRVCFLSFQQIKFTKGLTVSYFHYRWQIPFIKSNCKLTVASFTTVTPYNHGPHCFPNAIKNKWVSHFMNHSPINMTCTDPTLI